MHGLLPPAILVLAAACAAVERVPVPATVALPASAIPVPQEVGHALAGEHGVWREHPHHLSVLLAATEEDEHGEHETAFTVGLDYEHRLSDFLGLGTVFAEYAFGDLDAFTALAVADLHLWRGLVVQTGPGVERIGDEVEWVYRLGALYEFELGRTTVAPQAHYDATSGEDAVVYGVSVGYYF